MAGRADTLFAPPLGELNLQTCVLPHMEEFCVMGCCPPPPTPQAGTSNASDEAWSSTSETRPSRPSTTRSSFCLSDRAVSSSPARLKKPAPALPALPPTLPLSRNLDLAGLELPAGVMTGSHDFLAPSLCEARAFAEHEDLVLEIPTTPPPQLPGAVSAITWAASQTETPDGVSNQPWRTFWPPVIGSPWFEEVKLQRPDVLFFSFDPENHLLHQHHPWQTWKSQQHAGPQQLHDEDLDVSDSASTLFSDPGNEASSISHHSASATTQRIRDELDDLIQVDLQLPFVVPTQFNYLRPRRRYQYERPYRLQLPADLVPLPATNVQGKSYHPVRIYDISGHQDKFRLDVSGFQYVKCPIPVGEWDEQAITETYLPALLDWVVPLLGGDSGLVYSFNFRHHSSDDFVSVQRPWSLRLNPLTRASAHSMEMYHGNDDPCYSITRMLETNRRDDPFNAINKVEADPLGPCHWKQPLFRVHCDSSENTHRNRLPILRPSDADKLMSGRVREVSVWRKLSPHTQDTPLALCDARTVDPKDLVPMDVIYPHFADEVSEVRHNKNHRWFYNKSMTTDDAVIFMLHDTHAKGTVCPHSAFVDTSVPIGTPPRLSVEVKIMIFGGDIVPEQD